MIALDAQRGSRHGGSMDFFDQLNDFAKNITGVKLLLVACMGSVILYFFFNRTAEFSRNAIRNSAATIVVYVMNYGSILFFFQEINAFAQRAYAALHIPTLPTDFWSGPWLIAGVLLGVIGKDFCDYFIHRAMHTKWGFPAHAAHHTDTHVNGLTTFRVHAIEALLMSINYLVVLTWLQLPEAIPVVALLLLMHNMYVHLDLDWDHGRFKYLLASPVFHRWHHADVPEAYGKNLANMFPVFDLLFGTYYEAQYTKEPMGALKAGLSDTNPILIWIYPFQAWGRMILRAVRRRRARPMQETLPPAE